MEQESETPLLYDTVKRVGYSVRLAIHFLFIVVAFIGTVFLIGTLLMHAI